MLGIDWAPWTRNSQKTSLQVWERHGLAKFGCDSLIKCQLESFPYICVIQPHEEIFSAYRTDTLGAVRYDMTPANPTNDRCQSLKLMRIYKPHCKVCLCPMFTGSRIFADYQASPMWLHFTNTKENITSYFRYWNYFVDLTRFNCQSGHMGCKWRKAGRKREYRGR